MNKKKLNFFIFVFLINALFHKQIIASGGILGKNLKILILTLDKIRMKMFINDSYLFDEYIL